jgi:signal transduction histidine kinase
MSAHEKVNILMVDDQPAKLLSYEVILSELGENLIKATSGREALDHLLKTDIAVVLMDVSMPELDGFELAELIHQHPRYQKTAIIFISAVHLTDLDRLKGYEHGAVDYIAVPVIPELLRAKVGVFAELYRKTQQLERLNRELEQRVAERTAELQERAEALQRLNTELQRRNQELDAFTYIASHDLKEPLRGISNYAQFLIEDYRETLDAEGCQQLVTIQRLIQRMEDLLNSLLRYSRVERAELSQSDLDLTQVVQEALDQLQARLQGEHVQVRLPRSLPSARGDRAQLTEVFTNLLSNALKYNDKTEKWAEVGARNFTDSGPPVFYVRDNGIGISPEHCEKVFEIFRRLHPRDTYGGGTGAGLTIVKKIIERHGGRIWVESVPGEGSTFYFTLGEIKEKEGKDEPSSVDGRTA